jgi:hypothetical protein
MKNWLESTMTIKIKTGEEIALRSKIQKFLNKQRGEENE